MTSSRAPGLLLDEAADPEYPQSSRPALPHDELACTKCRNPLVVAGDQAQCTSCGTKFPVDHGVICTDRTDVFMGEFNARRMIEFVSLAREQGWRRTVKESMATEHRGAEAILMSPERGTFMELLGVPGKKSVLDIGAGMGAVSLRLASTFERVYALDQTFERLAFLQVVAEQEGAHGIRTVCHRDVFNLPFQSGTLDAVVMIGVFEYFPASYPDMPIGEVQRRALSELHRVLAPGGVLFMATKNRIGWPYWAGAQDNSGVRFGPLMPRPLANAVSRAVLHRPFRIVTDTYWRYASLLAGAGFRHQRFYWPIVGYQAPKLWIDLGDADAIRRGVEAYPAGSAKRGFFSALARAGLLKYAVPNFGVVARKPVA